jgi:Ca-activated chloride channel family protein
MKTTLRVYMVTLVLLLSFAPLFTAIAQDAGPQIRITQVDNSRFPQVIVYVSVTNAAGEPLGVSPNQIQVFENGQLVQPGQISGSGGIGPLTTLLVMDISGSMYDGGKLSAAKSAALAYIDQMRPGDQAGLVTFNTRVTYLQAVTADRAALIQAINGLDARGDTTMFDALDQAAQILQALPGRKAIIVLTDGLDNRSKFTADEVIQAISSSGLSISTIGLGDPSKLGTNSGLEESVLQSLASRAGGMYGYANDPAALTNLYEKYGRALQSEYSITYTSSSILHDGLSRTLTVSLGGSATTKASYNPGGVLPEGTHAAPWLVFVIILVVLVGLLFAPGLAARFLSPVSAKGEKNIGSKLEPRIKLK